MADEVEKIIIEVEEKGVKDTDRAMDSLNDTLAENSEANEEASESQEQYNRTLTDNIKDVRIFGVSLNSLSASFKATTGAIRASTSGLKLFKVALAATGIGLLVIALGSLVVFFTRSQEGADKLSKILGVIGAVINVILDRISDFGGGLVKLFSGDIMGGLRDMRNAFTGIGDAIGENIQRANDYQAALIRIRDANIILTVEFAKTNQRIAQAREASNDLNNTLLDRIEFTKVALRQQENLANAQIGFLKIQAANLKANLESSKTRSEDLQEIADLEAEIINKETQRALASIRIRNRLQVLEKEQIKERAEALEEFREGQAIAQAESDQADAERRQNVTAERLESEQITANGILDINVDLAEKLRVIQELNEKNQKASAQATKDFHILQNEAIADSAQALFGGLAALAGQNSAFGKASAIAEAIINTFKGVTAVLGDATLPTIAKAAFVAATIAQGLASVRRIQSTPLPQVQTVESVFAEGGMIRGASHNSPAGGVRVLAEGGEFIMNKKAMGLPGVAGLMESINALGSSGKSAPGVFAHGGFVPSNLQQLHLESAIQSQRSVLVVEDFTAEVNTIQVSEELSSL